MTSRQESHRLNEPIPFDRLLSSFVSGDRPVYEKLFSAMRRGDLCIEVPSDFECRDERFVLRENRLYLKAVDQLEEEVATLLAAFLFKSKKSAAPKAPALLNKEQQAAFARALTLPISIIAGGPGTGKSFTIEAILNELPSSRILVAAPTGKAVMQIKERMGHGHAEFMTLHKALGMGRPYRIPLDYDLVIIDESSMIDAWAMRDLMHALLPATRLVFVGDPHQLPPVDSGHFFADMVELFQEFAPDKITTLKSSKRTDSRDLLNLAERLKKGEMPEPHLFIEGALEEVLENFIPSFESLEAADENLQKRLILCPLRHGRFGINALNRSLAKRLVGRFVPILLNKSAPHLELVNGEMGVGYLGPLGLEKIFFKGRACSLSEVDVEIALCLSVHKAQGSEFDEVLLLMPEGSEYFGRAVLYTAATRARKKIQLWGARETYQKALESDSKRLSSFKNRALQRLEGAQKELADGRKDSLGQLSNDGKENPVQLASRR